VDTITELSELLLQHTQDTGYLASKDGLMYIAARVPDPEKNGEHVVKAVPLADFDLHAIGIVDPGDGSQCTWVVDIHHKSGRSRKGYLDDNILSDLRKLTRWATANRLALTPPDRPLGGRTALGTRILLYLESQHPPVYTTVEQVGYHPDLNLFITEEGVIHPWASAADPDAPYRPTPELVNSGDAPYAFGFALKEWNTDPTADVRTTARREIAGVLREIMTFHDATPLAVACSWMVMNLVQSSVLQHSSLFPVLAVEAPSGSGKTTGALSMSGQLLTGHLAGPAQGTLPDVRQKLAATRSGFVHLDDLDNPKTVYEMLRLSTADGTKSLRSARTGFTSSQEAKLTGGMLITGEYLGLDNQKALRDRTLTLELSDPSNRKSQHPGREHLSQWLDVTELRRKYPAPLGFAMLSGWVVSEILVYLDDLMILVEEEKPKAGRSGDKYAVVLAGACFIDHLRGEQGAWSRKGSTYRAVRQWVASQSATEAEDWENALTLEILPWALREFGDWFVGLQDPVRMSGHSFQMAPAFWYQGDPVFTPEGLSHAWRLFYRDGFEQRVHDKNALIAQAKRVGFVPSTARCKDKVRKVWRLKRNDLTRPELMERVDMLKERSD
jgi:hypothetical protein